MVIFNYETSLALVSVYEGHQLLLSFSPNFIFCIVIITSFIYLVIHFELKICSKLSQISLGLYTIVIIIIIIIIVITNYYSTFYKTKFEQISWFLSKWNIAQTTLRGTKREYSSKPLKHSIVKRILVFKR